MTFHAITRVMGCLFAVAALSACATRPQLSAQQESSQYLSRAGHAYTPPGPSSDPWGPYISEASAKYDVPERWIREVMRQESGGKLYNRSGQLITSGAGAMGLMQVMPATYDELRARYRELGADPFDPHNNILAGTAYIREMYDIYGSPGFLAAYNAGPGRLDDYLTRNRSLPEETRRYVASIGPKISGTFPRTSSPGEQYAMNALPFQIPDGPRYARADSRYSATPAAPIVLDPPPAQIAQATRPAYIVLNPPVRMAQLPEPPREAPAPYVPAQVVQLPEPPRPAPLPAQQFASALVPLPPPRSSGFALITPAHAEPIAPRRNGAVSGNWAVQVGAFANENLAAAATVSARDHARDTLGGARSQVASVRQPHGTLYRARLTGLSRDAATAACERLSRSRTNCIVVSPDAQS